MKSKGRRNYLLLVALLTAAVSFPAWGQDIESWILEALATVSDQQIEADALALTGRLPALDNLFIQSRHVRHPDHDTAIDYLTDRLEALGFDPWIEDFDCTGPYCANLIVDLPGSLNPSVIWIIGAHFDSTNGVDFNLPAEGAVDNASGVIAVLQTLAALKGYQFSDTIRFILFDAEEVGLVGSRVHAQDAADRGDAIKVMLNLDVPGYRSGSINQAFANSDAPSWPYLERMTHIPEKYPCGTNLIGLPTALIDTADMASFWDAGFNALMVGSLYSLTGWMNTAQDTYEKLDLAQCANVSRIMIAYLAQEAIILGLAEPGDDDDYEDDDTGNEQDDDDDAAANNDSGDDDDDDGCA